jgi:ribonucleoside-diphosphate reductase alpha chain
MVFYMEPWHYNIYEFLDLKETAGNDYVRTRTCNTALWIPDEFMNRVLQDADRWLFDPSETPELAETWGEEFEKHYRGYVAKAENNEMNLSKKVSARQLYRDMLIRLAKTGNYWFCFKDTHNRVNQAPNYGIIHSSNLCTEISIANRGDSTAVCTLASLNLTAFVNQDKVRKVDLSTLSLEDKFDLINWDDLRDTVQTAIQ